MSLRSERLTKLQHAYDLLPAGGKDSEHGLDSVAQALASAKQAGATDRECMDSMRSRDWRRYKKYKDRAREKGWLE